MGLHKTIEINNGNEMRLVLEKNVVINKYGVNRIGTCKQEKKEIYGDKKTSVNEHIEKFEILKNSYQKNINIILNQLLISFIEGRGTEEEWIEQKNELGIDFKFNFISVGIINIEKDILTNISKEHKRIQPLGLSLFALKNVTDDIMREYCENINFVYSNKLILIGLFKRNSEIHEFTNAINEICAVFSKISGGIASAGIGSIYKRIEDINLSYTSAQIALDYRMVLGTGRAIFIEDIKPDNNIQIYFDEEDQNLMIKSIKVASDDEIIKVINKVFSKMEKIVLPFNQYRIYIIEVTISLLKVAQSYKLNIDEIFGVNFNCYNCLEQFSSLNEAKVWFISKAIEINSLIKKEHINSTKILVEKAKKYILEHYSDSNISVEKLCSKLHVSPTYFSTVFKREMQISFVNYITTVRMEKAKELLKTTDYKTYIIAKKVGYLEANYFSYVFKKRFGVSPLKYKQGDDNIKSEIC